MKSQWDELKPGKFFVVTDFHNRPCGKVVRLDGYPFKIVALEFPFILCERHDPTPTCIDFRVMQIKVCCPKYAAAYWRSLGGEKSKSHSETLKEDWPRCVRCGERLRERKEKEGWKDFCPNCDEKPKAGVKR